MTSSTTGDRRWGTTRRSGMTILGKVAVPKPINLPSQRLENQGLDLNVEIVPKGTLSWGSKSSLNAWGTSSLSPQTESGPGSPSHLSNRPSSGGSLTRPSTADSDKVHESSSVARDSNSRPSSASGVFPSNQSSVPLQRPHSADTRSGSYQLSRFAESGSAEKLGVAPTKNDGFSLTSGEFPSLGAEIESFEKSTRPQDVRLHGRPTSSSGRYVEERSVDCTEEANVRIEDANAWRRFNQTYSEDAPRHCREEGQFDSQGSQYYHNANFSHQHDAWRGPPVNNHQGGGWYRGNNPYGAPMGPGRFQMDPFPFCPTQIPPIPEHGGGPRGNHATNENMFRPPMLDSYGHPRMQSRPGFYLGPMPYDGYYGPPMGYGSHSNRDLPFAGRPTGPHTYSMHSVQGPQGGYYTPGSSVALEQNEPSHSHETQRQNKVLLKPQYGRFGEDEAKREESLGNRFPNAEKVAQQMHTLKNDSRENSNETSGEVQPINAENAAPEDLSLIQKIEGLNAKTRTNDGWQNASSFVNGEEQESITRTFNPGNSVNNVSALIPRAGHGIDSKNSLHYKQGDLAASVNVDRRSTQQTQGRADLQSKQRVYSEGNDDSLDSIRKPAPGILADPNDNQRSTMRELARQRALQRQKEEEERVRDQRAKALAKLEELNRRSQVSEDGLVKNMEVASNASKQKRLGYMQKPNIVFEKTMAGNSFSVATTEVFDVVPSPEVVNEVVPSPEVFNDVVPSPEVLSHNSDILATSSITTESTFTKRKNNRNDKKKHKVEETTPMNTTRAAVGKETKSRDESIETGRPRTVEMEIKVSGNSSEPITSFTNEESQSRAKNNWKSQHVRRTPRNSHVNKPAEKFHGSSTVIWAPIHPQQKADVSKGVGTLNTAAVETEASAPQAAAGRKDQAVSMHGKQHASRSNTDGGSNYGDPKKANKRDYNKAHIKHSVQPDLPVASKESRSPGDHTSHTAVAPNMNKTVKYGGRDGTRDKAYGSQRKDVTGYEHQGFTIEQKTTSAETQPQSQRQSTIKEVQVDQNQNSMVQKNTGQSRRLGRGQESQGGWGLSAQENMPHHHQRPASNRDRQKQNVHYEYKPIGSRGNEGEHNREQLKESSGTEGPTYREKGQGNQRHGGQKVYQQQQRGTYGRNTGNGLRGTQHG